MGPPQAKEASVKVPPQLPSRVPCKLAFVGEAPGTKAIETGQPLAGPGGAIFFAMLRTAEIERSECLITNVFDEKPPGNDCSAWMKDEAISTKALARLSSELASARPNVVVALGGTALWALTGSDAVGSMRGTVLKASRVSAGTKLLPTFHPTFIQKQWKYYSVVVADLVKAAAEADKGPEFIYPKRRLFLEPHIGDLKRFAEKVLDHPERCAPLSVDIETMRGQITCIGFSPRFDEALCVPFVDFRKSNFSYWPTAEAEREAWRLVKRILESDVAKLGQNFCGYDWYVLRDVMKIRVKNISEDTRLLHHALYPELPKDLGFLGAAYTDLGAWKHWNKHGEKKDD